MTKIIFFLILVQWLVLSLVYETLIFRVMDSGCMLCTCCWSGFHHWQSWVRPVTDHAPAPSSRGCFLKPGSPGHKMTAEQEQEGTWIVLWKECCFYVNESGLVEQNMLKDLWWNLKARYAPNIPTPGYSNLPVAWLLAFLGPILAIIALLHVAPCLNKFLKWGSGWTPNCFRHKTLMIIITSSLFKTKMGRCVARKQCDSGSQSRVRVRFRLSSWKE